MSGRVQIFKLCPTLFSKGGEKILGLLCPLRPPAPMGAFRWGIRLPCPSLFSDGGDIIYHVSPHFFFMFCIWRGFKIKVTFVTFCVKSSLSGQGGKTLLKGPLTTVVMALVNTAKKS